MEKPVGRGSDKEKKESKMEWNAYYDCISGEQ
jgi:hypothetical protein